MTDWMPWGLVLMTGTFVTLWLALRAVGETPAGRAPDLRRARLALIVTVASSFFVYALYLVFQEGWLPY